MKKARTGPGTSMCAAHVLLSECQAKKTDSGCSTEEDEEEGDFNLNSQFVEERENDESNNVFIEYQREPNSINQGEDVEEETIFITTEDGLPSDFEENYDSGDEEEIILKHEAINFREIFFKNEKVKPKKSVNLPKLIQIPIPSVKENIDNIKKFKGLKGKGNNKRVAGKKKDKAININKKVALCGKGKGECEGEEELQQDFDDKSLVVSAVSSLPECKVRRNYACASCEFFTQNPRLFLHHRRDVHGERVNVHECHKCLYASKHLQKLTRHFKMVHGNNNNKSSKKDKDKSKEKESKPVHVTAETEEESSIATPKRKLTMSASGKNKTKSPKRSVLVQENDDSDSATSLKRLLDDDHDHDHDQDSDEPERLIVAENEYSTPEASPKRMIAAEESSSSECSSLDVSKVTNKVRSPKKRQSIAEGGEDEGEEVVPSKKAAVKNLFGVSSDYLKTILSGDEKSLSSKSPSTDNPISDVGVEVTAATATTTIKETVSVTKASTKRKGASSSNLQTSSSPGGDSGDLISQEDSSSSSAAVVEHPENIKCSVCAFIAKSRSQMAKHEREEHIRTKFFRCTKCTYVTHMKARFTKHVKYHSMPMIKCEMCDFRTPYKWNLDRHCKNHNGKGAFRCSACNFTADIKQSLTVHEMNHHIPPVGQAAGLGIGRRRNKVGASDAVENQDEPIANVSSTAADQKPTSYRTYPANKPSPDRSAYGSDFLHPDDIIHHANGNIYIKNKCKLCNYKSAWDAEMARHERKVHNIERDEKKPAAKKNTRPVPNLIPLSRFTPQEPSEPPLTQKDMNDICAKSSNSSLRDLASLFSSEDVFKNAERRSEERRIPDLIPTGKNKRKTNTPTFFDTLKERLLTETGETSDLVCPRCNHKSGCLSESLTHQKTCGKSLSRQGTPPIHLSSTVGSTRCQFCRQRCKSSADLQNHMKTCSEARAFIKEESEDNDNDNDNENENDNENDNDNDGSETNHPHPMENKVFVWNNFEEKPIGYDQRAILQEAIFKQFQKNLSELNDRLGDEAEKLFGAIKHESDDYYNSQDSYQNDTYSVDSGGNNDYQDYSSLSSLQIHSSVEEKTPKKSSSNKRFRRSGVNLDDDQDQDFVSSLDLSVRTSSPTLTPLPNAETKIPTHGTDISVAQHKRVFKCPHCSFWASTASRFHVHIVGHLNKKPFECSLCAYRSNWRWDITKHIKLKSVRDPSHESAKVLMTDETGRRNYTKYNKYLTEIHVSGDPGETSGGSGTRPKAHREHTPPTKVELPRAIKTPDFGTALLTKSASGGGTLRPPPPLLAAPAHDKKKTLWKCKKCNFRDSSKEKLLQHVKIHYEQSEAALLGSDNNGGCSSSLVSQLGVVPSSTASSLAASVAAAAAAATAASTAAFIGAENTDEASLSGGGGARGHAPFRCGHCNQVSNWKHVIQRHCRLKHHGDIKVVIGSKNGPEKIEVDEQYDEPDHVDIQQTGVFKCKKCPYSSDVKEELDEHFLGHTSTPESRMKCFFCQYFVAQPEDLNDHLKLHGINEPEEFIKKMLDRIDSGDKRYHCMTCPYVTNSKSQFSYHKQFHKPRGGQYNCNLCGYNVSKRHLLNQHMKVHGISMSPQKLNGEVSGEDLVDMSEEIEEVYEAQNQSSTNSNDIPLVWVSRFGKFSKMFKCRYCPHVNLRKVNIQEHEKMHSVREKNPNSTRTSDVEHHCPECNYVCNNAGVLSSHSKVHQPSNGVIHGAVDPTKSDEEQIREYLNFNTENSELNLLNKIEDGGLENEVDCVDDDGTVIFFCQYCPARFFKENEFAIHVRLHNSRLFYKCEYCSYTARQNPHISAHSKVHGFDYQERTKQFLSLHTPHSEYSPPKVYEFLNENGDKVFAVKEQPSSSSSSSLAIQEGEENCDEETTTTLLALKNHQSVKNQIPLSGTELFQQKSELEFQSHHQSLLSMKLSEASSSSHTSSASSPSPTKGNPNIIYPTYLKNGKMMEKRYKCHKCPTAFEKREQYNNHLNLHGSKQKYECSNCDYSVKYYANFVQHEKRHNPANFENCGSGSKKMRLSSSEDDCGEEPFCPLCPFTTPNKEILAKHLLKHSSVPNSVAIKNEFVCNCCDYTDSSKEELDEHTKLHFMGLSVNNLWGRHKIDGGISYNEEEAKFKMELIQDQEEQQSNGSSVIRVRKDLQFSHGDDDVEDEDEDDEDKGKKNIAVFEQTQKHSSSGISKQKFVQYLLNNNNNEGEKLIVDPNTGEFLEHNPQEVKKEEESEENV